MKKQLSSFIAVLFLLSILISGCRSTQPTPTYIQGDERDQVSAITAPYAEDILKGIQTNDYTLFTSDFDETMSKAMDETQFSKIVKAYGELGAPQSYELINIEDSGSYYGVNYKVTYSSKVVIMKIVINKAAPNLVSGLWFK